MFPILSLSITPATMLDLLSFVASKGTPDQAAELAEQAIREWLADARSGTSTAQRAETQPRGYRWKSLFLPEGTQLRVWSREDGSRYAEVKGDRIIHAGQALSPNRFVSMMDGIPRNAWTEIALLMPGETAWQTAAARRSAILRAGQAQEQARARGPAAPTPLRPASAAPISAAVPIPPAAPIPPIPPIPPAAPAAPHATHLPPPLSADTAPAPCAALAARRSPTPAPALAPALTSALTPASPRLPRIPPDASQARLQARQDSGAPGHWWPGAPERRTYARRLEDTFRD